MCYSEHGTASNLFEIRILIILDTYPEARVLKTFFLILKWPFILSTLSWSLLPAPVQCTAPGKPYALTRPSKVSPRTVQCSAHHLVRTKRIRQIGTSNPTHLSSWDCLYITEHGHSSGFLCHFLRLTSLKYSWPLNNMGVRGTYSPHPV